MMKQMNKKGVEEESTRMKKIGIRNLILRAKARIPKYYECTSTNARNDSS